MKDYFVVLKQEGEGCDYTIGCGISFRFFKAKNENDLYNKIINYYGNAEFEDIYYTESRNIVKLNAKQLEEEHVQYLKLKEKFE